MATTQVIETQWAILDRRACVLWADSRNRCHYEMDAWTAYLGEYRANDIMWHKGKRGERAVLIRKDND